jgi:hypothetical protein
MFSIRYRYVCQMRQGESQRSGGFESRILYLKNQRGMPPG